jgi:hypothetical protein
MSLAGFQELGKGIIETFRLATLLPGFASFREFRSVDAISPSQAPNLVYEPKSTHSLSACMIVSGEGIDFRSWPLG